jgi:hypothetical protein
MTFTDSQVTPTTNGYTCSEYLLIHEKRARMEEAPGSGDLLKPSHFIQSLDV